MNIVYIIFTVGILLIIIGFWYLFSDRQAKKWNKTIGTIISSELKEKKRIISDENGTYYQTEYKCDFIYKFSAKEFPKNIKGSKLTIKGNQFDIDKLKHMKICEKLKPSTKVSIYYNPSNPEKNCLVVGKDNRPYFTILLGVLFIISIISYSLSNSDINIKLLLKRIEIKK